MAGLHGGPPPELAARVPRRGSRALRRPIPARRTLRAACGGERGQGTVEFALVTAGLLAVIVACGALWRSFEGGLFVEHALTAASHHVQGVAPGAVADVFLY